MKSKSVMLIAGGGYADIPLIMAAKELGYYVVTTGNRPEELGHRHSDEYRKADYSSPEDMLELARTLKVSAVCACCNDFSALSCAYVAEQMHLPGHDSLATAKIIHHKDLFREFSLLHGIPVPHAIGATNHAECMAAIRKLDLPIIIKPVDLTGGKGVSTITALGEAAKAVEKAFNLSRVKRVVVESFITGSRHGFSAFLVDGRVVFYFSDNEHYYINPYLVSGASVPTVVRHDVNTTLCKLSEQFALLLHLRTGVFHIQYILHRGKPVIIEICRRAPGDLYVKLVQHATGVDYSAWIVKASAGIDCCGLSHVEPRGCYLRHCVMASRTGILKDVVFDSSIRHNVIDCMMWWKKGDFVTDALTNKFGIVFLRFDSALEMLEKAERMHELIRTVIE